MGMQDVKAAMANVLFDMDIESVLAKRICISCKKPIHITETPDNIEGNIYSRAGAAIIANMAKISIGMK